MRKKLLSLLLAALMILGLLPAAALAAEGDAAPAVQAVEDVAVQADEETVGKYIVLNTDHDESNRAKNEANPLLDEPLKRRDARLGQETAGERALTGPNSLRRGAQRKAARKLPARPAFEALDERITVREMIGNDVSRL